MKGNAVLFSEMTPPPGGEDAFNAWYDDHHMPHHVKGVPGFLSGQRYKSPVGPHYLAIYELGSTAALETQEYRTRKYSPEPATKAMLDSVTGFTRYIGQEAHCAARPDFEVRGIEAQVILAEFFAVPFDRATEFNGWYDTEHIPILLGCADWRMARRMVVVDSNPEPYSHMCLHYLDDRAALESEAVALARGTDWHDRLAEEPWFLPHRVAYERRGTRVLSDD